MYWLVVLVTIAAATPVAGQQPPIKYERPVPPGVTLHFKNTVSVAKRPDGSCDWGRVKLRPGQLGTSSYMGARDDSTCTGVVYNVTFPPDISTPIHTDSGTFFARRLPFEPPPPQLGGSDSAIVVNLVRLMESGG